jgi:hypothetical protein
MRSTIVVLTILVMTSSALAEDKKDDPSWSAIVDKNLDRIDGNLGKIVEAAKLGSDKLFEAIKAYAPQIYRVVKMRVMAESIVWIVLGLLASVGYFFFARFAWMQDCDDNPGWAVGSIVSGLAVLGLLVASAFALVDLISLDYATAKRIVELIQAKQL